jgi:hypothetical protein
MDETEFLQFKASENSWTKKPKTDRIPKELVDRKNDVTAHCVINASGRFIPRMFIFTRTRMNPMLQTGGPEGTICHCSKNS